MKLASLFQDGAVLQRDMDIPVWGKSEPGVYIEAVLDGKSAATRCSADGSFMIYLPSHEAGGPYELTVTIPELNETLVLKDILIGEVWLASGQSNMEYLLGSDWRIIQEDDDSEVLGRKQEKLFGEMVNDPDKLRFFNVEKNASGTKETSCKGSWCKMTAENIPQCCAVGGWFSLGLQMHLDVPVGLIASSWGGTIAEAWTSYEALAAAAETRNLAKMVRRIHWAGKDHWKNSVPDKVVIDFEKIDSVKADPGIPESSFEYTKVDFDDSDWQSMNVGGSWIKQHINNNGSTWVRKSVDIPESWSGCHIHLQGGAVDKHDITFFNGVEIGRTGSGFDLESYNIQRSYPIPPELVKAGKAVVAIRGFAFAYDGGVNGKWKLVNDDNGEKIDLCGEWKAKAEYDFGMANISRIAGAFGRGNPNTPSILFNGMINPLLPYALRGVIWYQGESNAKSVKDAVAYRDILQNMIDDWRRAFGNPDMPFIMVQLAGFGPKEAFFVDSPWAELRESQRLLAKNDPDTFMATAIDIGEEEDIHPQNKFDVGKRLAMCALHHVYDCADAVPSGPEAVKAEVEGSAVRVTFKYADGMKLISEEPVFFLAGEDGKFFAADKVEVDGESVILSAAAVPVVREVRCSWADFPSVTLYNAAGLPASSFRMELK
ncbi:MAG: hypothetical protein E7057_08875 [Lentisphaerae bacterium]|nr:hypothetical protein [Lentisphaerota bacterium]